MTRPNSNASGILLMIQASFAFSLMALCVKFASRTLPSLEIVFFRSLIGTLMIFSLMHAKRVPLFGSNRNLLVLRGVSGFLALSLHFYTIGHLPLGTAVLLNSTSPIFAAILAITYLGERPGRILVAMILVAFFGVFLLVKGNQTAAVLTGKQEVGLMTFLGLLSSAFAAVAYVSIRAIRKRENVLTVILYFTAISTVGSLFFLPFGFRWPDATNWLELAGVGIGSFYGQLWMTEALRKAPTSVISPFFYLTPLFSFLYGLIFFKETLGLSPIVGACLIVISGSLISYVEARRPS